MKTWVVKVAIGLASLGLWSCSGGGGSSSSNGRGSSNTITGQISKPGQASGSSMSFKAGSLSLPDQASPVAHARIEMLRTNSKGQAIGRPIATTTADANGNFELPIPADINLSEVSTIIVAKEPDDDTKIYQSFVTGKRVDVNPSTNSTQLAIRVAMMAELDALLSELTPEEVEQLHGAARAILLNSNVPNFSAAYNAVRNNRSFTDKLDEVTTTDLSGVDFSKVPPITFFPRIINNEGEVERTPRFKTGDRFRVQARAVDPMNLPLEYRFKMKRDCDSVEVVQDWSANHELIYDFTVTDVTNCTYLVVQIKNNDGSYQAGKDFDAEYEIEFTSQPTWRRMSQVNQHRGYVHFAHTFMETKMFVWGGFDHTLGDHINTGAIYDPELNSWSAVSNVNAPSVRALASATYCAGKVLVFGGEHGHTVELDPKVYDPSTNTWHNTSTVNRPPRSINHTTNCINGKVYILGGSNQSLGTTLSRFVSYDVANDTWETLTSLPRHAHYHTTVYTGTKLITFGGNASDESYYGDGFIYDFNTGVWSAISTTGAPSPRLVHVSGWTGNRMLVWGGMTPNAQTQFNDGALYDPVTDTWTPMPSLNAPAGRSWLTTAGWVGDGLMIWGGYLDSGSTPTNTGAVFSAKTNRWKTTSQNEGTPAARAYHTTIWTGKELIIWGGHHESGNPTGAIYAP